jgi:hypothetical protein
MGIDISKQDVMIEDDLYIRVNEGDIRFFLMEDNLRENFRGLPDKILEPGLERDARKEGEARREQQE